jgi:multidrug efflux pump subunit AcrA (membrane-fusion protein)
MQASKRFLTPFKWVLTLGILAALLAGAYFFAQMRKELAPETGEGASQLPKFKAGEIKLNKVLIESYGIQVEPAKEIDWVPKATVYGRVVANPRATTEIRAAFAGRLRTANGNKWPTLAGPVKAGDVVGQLEVRLGPQDRLDLQAKLNDALQKQVGAEKLVHIQKERVKRFDATSGSLARSELDAALKELVDAETQFASADAAVKLYQDALKALDQPADPKQTIWLVPVTAPAGGEVVELLARPDMVIEAGGLIARVVDFTKALVRVDIPLSVLPAAPPSTLKLFVLPSTPPGLERPTNRTEPAEPSKGVPAELVGVAAQVDPTLQAAGYLYEVSETAGAAPGTLATRLWRPGLFVKAYLDVSAAKPISAVTVPNSALLYHQGRALVYVRLSGDRFKRVEVRVLGRDGDRWVLEADRVDPDDLVVTEGALRLLSEEFRADVDD